MTRRRRRSADEAPGWVWMLFGLGIGLIIALGVYLNGPALIGSPPAALLAPAQEPQNATGAAAPAGQSGQNATGAAAQNDAAAGPTADGPGSTAADVSAAARTDEPETAETARGNDAGGRRPAEPAEDPNRFSFYDLLPSFEVIIPEVETPAPRQEAVVAIETPGLYMLQAGSFLTMQDAEAQRARVGLLGIESRLQRVTIDDRAFHRVRIGPIENLEELNSIRARLRMADIDSIVMRVDP